jgi:pyridoxine 5'-phosphate synthase PdxJ
VPTGWSCTPSPTPAPGARRAGRLNSPACAAAQAALDAGLGVNAGHDLNRDNLPTSCAVPGVQEVSIGHALISDALELGYAATVQRLPASMQALHEKLLI